MVVPVYGVNYPSPVGYVNDFASLYSESFRQNLNSQLQELDTKTSTQFVVVTVKNLESISIEEYANQLFSKWAIGQKNENNGLLLLISKEDRKLRFEIGYGLEGQITDGTAGQIIRNDISPRFKEGDYEAGTSSGVTRIFQLLNYSSSTVTPPPVPKTKLPQIFDALPILLVIFVYLSAFLARTREYYAGGVIGFIVGLIFTTLGWAAIISLIGFILDYLLSKNYKTNLASGQPTDFFKSFGGFKGGGGWGGGGGFSGGGGRSGGGGASGGW